MKKDIHPKSYKVTIRCACGNSFETTSTTQRIDTDICSACHPFFTGTQKFVDTAGRIEKFQRRYASKTKTTAKKAKTTPKTKTIAKKTTTTEVKKTVKAKKSTKSK